MNFGRFLYFFVILTALERSLACLDRFRHVLEAYIDLPTHLSCLPGGFARWTPQFLLRYFFLLFQKSDFCIIKTVIFAQ